jgi:2-polyprenyl-3-methyl-5-hydroxy-6-metoxy-1,4-benzoquinol methylase
VVDLLADFEELGSEADDIVDVLRSVGVHSNSRVIDLGAGKGSVAVAVATEIGCDVTGIELHKPFVDLANNAAHTAGVAQRCRFIHGDILQLVGALDEADAVIYAALGDVLGPLDETIRAIRLFAKPGGHIVITDCVLRDGPTATFPGFENYTTIGPARERLTAAGDAIVAEELDTDDPDDDHENSDHQPDADAIEARAHQIAARRPDLRAELERFAQSQRDEYLYLEQHTTPVIWALQRKP